MNKHRKLVIALGVGLLTATVSGLCYPDPTPFEFKRASPQAANTPGISIIFAEEERHVEAGVTQIKYDISFSGLPKDKIYAMAMKGPGIPWVGIGDATNGIEFSISESGALSFKKSGAPYVAGFVVNKYVKGEYRDFGVRSNDGQIFAKYRLVPFPLEGGNGTCRIAMLIADPKAEAYFLEGDGFEPDGNVEISLISGDRTSRETATIDAEGRIGTLIILNHSAEQLKGKMSSMRPGEGPPLVIEINRTAFFGKSGGDATVKAVQKSCAPEIHYYWGTEAKKFQ